MQRILTIFILTTAAAFAQLTTASTTLSSAVTSTNTDQWCLASASGVVVPTSTANGSYLLADREAVQVMSQGYTSTCFKVKRGQLGTSASVGHSAASTVWIGQPATSNGDPSRPFSGAFVNTVPTGSCVASAQYTLPVIYTGSAAQGAIAGSAWGCVQSQWVQVGNSQLVGLTGTNAIFDIYSFGAGAVFRGSHAAGTPSSPTATQNGTGLVSLGGRGYGATGYASASRGSIVVTSTENWTDTSQGTRLLFLTTPNGSTTTSSVWTIENDGNFTPFTSGAVGIGTAALPVKSLALVNCTSAASPSVCGASTVGAVAMAAAATTLTVNTTAVTAKSRIIVDMDASLGSDLSVTCNVNNIAVWISARVPGTSFTITAASGPVTNPMCMSYTIVN
jgi:hypothetical protein